MNFFRFSFFCVYLFALICFYASAAQDSNSLNQNPIYDQVYPYYVEVCAVSRFQPKGREPGGSWGHALMYLKGACIDENAPYPKLRMCREGEVDLSDAEAGVGVSVDKMFKSVNWVAVPGKKLFYDGNLEEGKPLTAEHFQKTTDAVFREGYFRGVKLHEPFLKEKPEALSEEAWAVQNTAGTDYAIRFARTSICASLPLQREHLQPIIDYLNRRNEEIFSQKEKFEWNPYDDNCAHTVHNALSAAGVWKPKPMNQSRIKQVLNIAIPANEVAAFAFYTQRLPDFDEVNSDEGLKSNLKERNWLPMRHGALLKVLRPHSANDLFETKFDLSVLEVPFHKRITRKIKNRLKDPRYTDIQANLSYFREEYQALLEFQPSVIQRWLPGKEPVMQAGEREYVALQAEDAATKITLLDRASTGI